MLMEGDRFASTPASLEDTVFHVSMTTSSGIIRVVNEIFGNTQKSQLPSVERTRLNYFP